MGRYKKFDAIKSVVYLHFLRAENELSARSLSSYFKEERNVNISKSIIAQWMQDEKWREKRDKTQNKIMKLASEDMIKATAKAKSDMIIKAEALSLGIYEELSERIKKPDYQIGVKDFVSLQKLVAELRGILASHGGGTSKQIIFNINVPVEYITAEGLEWLDNKQNNPNPDEQAKSIVLDEKDYNVE